MLSWAYLASCDDLSREDAERTLAWIGRWTSHVVPYVISDEFNAAEKKAIEDGFATWDKETCLTFKPRENEDDYILVRSGSSCSSALGKNLKGGKQEIILQAGACTFEPTILHEIGHSLGLAHEHQHPDRDTGVILHPENMGAEQFIWVNKHVRETKRLGDDYDIDSVMHYGARAFIKKNSTGNGLVMSTRDPSLQTRLTHMRRMLSFSDIREVNVEHHCSAKCTEKVECDIYGFVDHNCKCRTPQEYFDRVCVNTADSDWCLRMFHLNRCNSEDETAIPCRKMCDMCPMYKIPRKKLTGGCENTYYDDSQCETWAQEGRCNEQRFKELMEKQCNKACNYCGPNKGKWVGPCKDDLPEYCAGYSDRLCQTSYQWMKVNCRKRCGHCE